MNNDYSIIIYNTGVSAWHGYHDWHFLCSTKYERFILLILYNVTVYFFLTKVIENVSNFFN